MLDTLLLHIINVCIDNGNLTFLKSLKDKHYNDLSLEVKQVIDSALQREAERA